MKIDNFFTELKRRNVFRAATFYAASAWLLVQVATQVFPFFHIADPRPNGKASEFRYLLPQTEQGAEEDDGMFEL